MKPLTRPDKSGFWYFRETVMDKWRVVQVWTYGDAIMGGDWLPIPSPETLMACIDGHPHDYETKDGWTRCRACGDAP